MLRAQHQLTHAVVAVLKNKHLLPTDMLSCCCADTASRCVQPYMPGHQSQMLLYSASNSGELKLAEQYAEDSVAYPGTFGIMHMSDGKHRLNHLEARPA